MSTSGIGKTGGSTGRSEFNPEESVGGAAPAKARAKAGAAEAAEAAAGEAAPTEAPAAHPSEAAAAALLMRRAGSRGINSDMLRRQLEAKIQGDHGAHGKDAPRAAQLPTGRDALHGAAVHAAARKTDPKADEKLLSGAAHDQKALLSDCRSAARTLGLHVDRAGSKSWVSQSGRARADASGRATLDADGLRASGEANATYGVSGSKSGSVDGRLGSASGSVSGDAMAYARAKGDATIGEDGLRAQGVAEVGVRVKVNVDGEFRTKGVRIGGETLDVNGNIHGEAEVSAYARADADVAATPNPPRLIVVANASAFAGAKASAHGSIGLGDFVKLSGSAEAWAGAGAEAGVVAGYDDGKLKLGFNAGAAVGYGAGMSFCVEIDVKKIGKALLSAATGGLVNLDVLLDRGDGNPPLKLAQVELLYPPYLQAKQSEGTVEVDRSAQTDRYEARKRERDAAERHVRDAIQVKAGSV